VVIWGPSLRIMNRHPLLVALAICRRARLLSVGRAGHHFDVNGFLRLNYSEDGDWGDALPGAKRWSHRRRLCNGFHEHQSDTYLFRLLPDSIPDSSFNGDGKLFYNICLGEDSSLTWPNRPTETALRLGRQRRFPIWHPGASNQWIPGWRLRSWRYLQSVNGKDTYGLYHRAVGWQASSPPAITSM
jgi:hypothetical protein